MKKDKKQATITLRIDEKTLNRLDMCAKNCKTNRSDYIRSALSRIASKSKDREKLIRIAAYSQQLVNCVSEEYDAEPFLETVLEEIWTSL